MKVLQLTTEQKDSLVGKRYDGVQYFNPVQDANGVWIISKEERDNCTDETYTTMLDSLSEIDFNKPEYEI